MESFKGYIFFDVGIASLSLIGYIFQVFNQLIFYLKHILLCVLRIGKIRLYCFHYIHLFFYHFVFIYQNRCSSFIRMVNMAKENAILRDL